MPRNHRLDRRTTLAGIGLTTLALAIGGCTPGRAKSVSTTLRTDPLGPLFTQTTALIRTYDTTIARYPALAPIIGRLRDEQRQHAIALAALMGIPAPAITPGPDASGISLAPSIPATPSVPASVPPGSPVPTADPLAAARATLRDAEKTAQLDTVAACLNAVPDRVAVLASIAASRATHVAALAVSP